jgi:hypothetical protein
LFKELRLGISPFHRAFQFTIYNGPNNALICNKTLIQMSHTKTLKITPTCFDYQMIIIREFLIPHMKTQILTSDFNRDQKLPDDDHLIIETCWSDFKCFSV